MVVVRGGRIPSRRRGPALHVPPGSCALKQVQHDGRISPSGSSFPAPGRPGRGRAAVGPFQVVGADLEQGGPLPGGAFSFDLGGRAFDLAPARHHRWCGSRPGPVAGRPVRGCRGRRSETSLTGCSRNSSATSCAHHRLRAVPPERGRSTGPRWIPPVGVDLERHRLRGRGDRRARLVEPEPETRSRRNTAAFLGGDHADADVPAPARASRRCSSPPVVIPGPAPGPWSSTRS